MHACMYEPDCSDNTSIRQPLASIQPNTDAILPTVAPRIQHDAIRERIRFAGRDGRDMVLIPVDDGEDLEGCLLEHILHRFADFCAFRLRPRRSNSNIQRPNLPANLLLPLPRHPRQSPKPHSGPPSLLLIELDGYPTAHAATPAIENVIAARSGGKVLADERGDTGVDEGFEIDVVDGGEGEVEDVEGGGTDGGEVSVEEN